MKKSIGILVDLLKWIGAAAVAGMMFLTCADVIMRAVSRPIPGAVEVAGFLATIALACSLPYTHMAQGHVGVEMLVRRFPKQTRALVDLATGILALVLFALVAWQSFDYASTLKQSGEVSMTLEFPAYLFVYFIGLTFIALALTIVLDITESIKKAAGK